MMFMMTTATTSTMAVTCMKVLSVLWVVVMLPVRAQQHGVCGSLHTQYALNNVRNLSVGLSSDLLHQVLLPPLIAQPRVAGTIGSDKARYHIKEWMRAAGWTVEDDVFLDYTTVGQRRFANVIATLHPNRPRRVVLACHYDSKLMPEWPRPFVGAIDSAVPCSLLIELALVLRDHFSRSGKGNLPGGGGGGSHVSSNLTVQFIFFDGEEAFGQWSASDSLYGARHLANQWLHTPDPNAPGLNKLQTINVFILLDLIGTADTHFVVRFAQTAGVYSKLHHIESCLKARGYLKVTGNPVPLFTTRHDYSSIEDDHLPFLQKGVPVVHLITSPFPWVWHTSYDDEAALDYNRIENLARILRVFLVDLNL